MSTRLPSRRSISWGFFTGSSNGCSTVRRASPPDSDRILRQIGIGFAQERRNLTGIHGERFDGGFLLGSVPCDGGIQMIPDRAVVSG